MASKVGAHSVELDSTNWIDDCILLSIGYRLGGTEESIKKDDQVVSFIVSGCLRIQANSGHRKSRVLMIGWIRCHAI